jgi:hypothetical protein
MTLVAIKLQLYNTTKQMFILSIKCMKLADLDYVRYGENKNDN